MQLMSLYCSSSGHRLLIARSAPATPNDAAHLGGDVSGELDAYVTTNVAGEKTVRVGPNRVVELTSSD
jgi:hypothetical protein